MGEYEASVQLPSESSPVLRLTTTLKTTAPILFPYWPRDIVSLDDDGEVYDEADRYPFGSAFFSPGVKPERSSIPTKPDRAG
jgi:hypothetical protein